MNIHPLVTALTAPGVAERFAADRRLRLQGALPSDEAGRLADHLKARQDWAVAMAVDGKTARIPLATLAQAPREQQQKLSSDLMAGAAKGEGFQYDGIEIDAATDGVLGDLYAALSDDDVLGAVSDLIGATVTSVSAQATRYRPGQWLTRHRDDPQEETRQLAYVLSVTEQWHPDWGGLLQFFEDDGSPRDAWAPGFGVLSVFDVRLVHSVTYVTPWAQAPRLAVTGWFSI